MKIIGRLRLMFIVRHLPMGCKSLKDLGLLLSIVSTLRVSMAEVYCDICFRRPYLPDYLPTLHLPTESRAYPNAHIAGDRPLYGLVPPMLSPTTSVLLFAREQCSH